MCVHVAYDSTQDDEKGEWFCKGYGKGLDRVVDRYILY